ncbi:MAG: acyl-CoA thioesterase [Alistipes sp.]|nr:acyl-CoA thioesterase [Candidatus Alistipes equi]
MFKDSINIRVSYKDTDKMGVVHHSNYLVYYETARTEILRNHGLVYSSLEKEGIISPILEVESKYLRPVHYDELIVVEATFSIFSPCRLEVRYEVRDTNARLVNTGRTLLAFLDKKDGRPVAIPEKLVELIKAEEYEQ